jgi:predicted DNA-binding protein YlxM (UPF0122 family)
LVEKNLQISLLLDFYGQMLTEKQREVVEYYYNEDLSLAEIAAHCGITRQGVRDSIKRAELVLTDCEEKLGLMARFHDIQDGLAEIIETAEEIQREYGKRALMNDLSQKTQRIIDLAGELGSGE